MIQYIPRNMHTVTALLCFVVVKHWLIFPNPSSLLHWHCGNLTIAPVPAKQPWWIWINSSCEFIMNDCIITTKQNTTKPCAYFLGYTVSIGRHTNTGIVWCVVWFGILELANRLWSVERSVAVVFWKYFLVLFEEWWTVQFAVCAISINMSPKQSWSLRMKLGNFNVKLLETQS